MRPAELFMGHCPQDDVPGLGHPVHKWVARMAYQYAAPQHHAGATCMTLSRSMTSWPLGSKGLMHSYPKYPSSGVLQASAVARPGPGPRLTNPPLQEQSPLAGFGLNIRTR